MHGGHSTNNSKALVRKLQNWKPMQCEPMQCEQQHGMASRFGWNQNCQLATRTANLQSELPLCCMANTANPWTEARHFDATRIAETHLVSCSHLLRRWHSPVGLSHRDLQSISRQIIFNTQGSSTATTVGACILALRKLTARLAATHTLTFTDAAFSVPLDMP